MSFYIRIDNPNALGPASLPHEKLLSPLAEGSKKVCLVTAFMSAISDTNPAGSGFRRENHGVAVTLAGEGAVLLPFLADEFEDLLLDAQRKGTIADFTRKHWSALLDDLVAIRKPALVP